MSRDLFSKKPGRRNWARGAALSSQGKPGRPTGPVIAGSLPAPIRKIALGTMALGTLAGLAFITSPWWRPLPKQTNLRRDPMRRRMFLSPGAAPSSRVMWSRR